MRSKVPVAQVVTMAVLVVGLGFGVWQVKQSQDIKKSEASDCSVCTSLGECKCDDGHPLLIRCLPASVQCKSLRLTWKEDPTCAQYSCQGSAKGGGPPRPSQAPTPTPPGTRPKPSQAPTPTPPGTRPAPTPTPTPVSRPTPTPTPVSRPTPTPTPTPPARYTCNGVCFADGYDCSVPGAGTCASGKFCCYRE